MADDELDIPGLTDARVVGEGGFGRVFVAEQTAFHREVAVKLLDAKVTDENARMRFERECAALGKLSDHPNIVTVYGNGFDSANHPYILMTHLSGGSYADRIRERGPMAWPEVVDVGVAIAGALETAHRAGVLHRDVKPENLLTSSYDEPTLVDFGIARLEGGPATTTGKVTTSIPHAAPEVLGGGEPHATWDTYALGSTLFTLLTGSYAFVFDNDHSVLPALRRIAEDPVPDLRPRGVPDDLCRIIETAMAKHPGHRYQSALSMGRALQQVQQAHGQPLTPLVIPGEPPTPPSDAPVQNVPTVPQQAFVALPPVQTPQWQQTPQPGQHWPQTPQPGQHWQQTPQPGQHWGPGPPPRRSNTGVFVAIAGVVVLVAVGLGAWLLTRGDDGQVDVVDDGPTAPDVGPVDPPQPPPAPPPQPEPPPPPPPEPAPPPPPPPPTAELFPGDVVTGALTASAPVVTYAFEGFAGEQLEISMTAVDSSLDPYLRLLDPAGEEIAVDDDGGDGLNALLVATLPVDGDYTIVADSFLSDDTGAFELGVVLPDSGEAIVVLEETGTVSAADTPVPFTFEAFAGEQLTIAVVPVEGATPLSDPRVALQDGSGTEVARDDDGGEGLNPLLTYTVPADGTYTALVDGFAGGTGDFAISIISG